jgi:hypothetical protein
MLTIREITCPTTSSLPSLQIYDCGQAFLIICQPITIPYLGRTTYDGEALAPSISSKTVSKTCLYMTMLKTLQRFILGILTKNFYCPSCHSTKAG